MKNYITIPSLLIGLFLLAVCGGTNLGTNPPPPDPRQVEDLINAAWVKYEAGLYNDAIGLFNEARDLDNSKLDIYNGLGWSYFQAHNLLNSLANHSIAIDADSSFADAMVGYSVSAFEKNEYEQAIIVINTIARIDTSGFDIQGTDDYTFIHDTSVTARKVRKILALCYFYSGNFLDSYAQLKNYLDPFTKLDPSSDTFVTDLFKALEKI